MERFRVDPKGDGLAVEIRFEYPQIYTYTFWLWERDSEDIALTCSGDDRTVKDNHISLPDPPAANDGRIFQFEVTVTAPDREGEARYGVDVVIYQGVKELGRIVSPVDKSKRMARDTLRLRLRGMLEVLP